MVLLSIFFGLQIGRFLHWHRVIKAALFAQRCLMAELYRFYREPIRQHTVAL